MKTMKFNSEAEAAQKVLELIEQGVKFTATGRKTILVF